MASSSLSASHNLFPNLSRISLSSSGSSENGQQPPNFHRRRDRKSKDSASVELDSGPGLASSPKRKSHQSKLKFRENSVKTVTSEISTSNESKSLESRLESTLRLNPTESSKTSMMSPNSINDHGAGNVDVTPILSPASRSTSSYSSSSTIRVRPLNSANNPINSRKNSFQSIDSDHNSERTIQIQNQNTDNSTSMEDSITESFFLSERGTENSIRQERRGSYERRHERPGVRHNNLRHRSGSNATPKDLNLSTTSSDFSWAYDQFEINIAKKIQIIYENINSIFHKKSYMDIFTNEQSNQNLSTSQRKFKLNEFGMSKEILSEIDQWHRTFDKGSLPGAHDFNSMKDRPPKRIRGICTGRVPGGDSSSHIESESFSEGQSLKNSIDFREQALDEILNWSFGWVLFL